MEDYPILHASHTGPSFGHGWLKEQQQQREKLKREEEQRRESYKHMSLEELQKEYDGYKEYHGAVFTGQEGIPLDFTEELYLISKEINRLQDITEEYTVRQIYDHYERDLISAGEALDYYLQNQLNNADPELCKYIVDKDGDELTDDEALELAYLRLKQLEIEL